MSTTVYNNLAATLWTNGFVERLDALGLAPINVDYKAHMLLSALRECLDQPKLVDVCSIPILKMKESGLYDRLLRTFYQVFEQVPGALKKEPDIGERAFFDLKFVVDNKYKKQAIDQVLWEIEKHFSVLDPKTKAKEILGVARACAEDPNLSDILPEIIRNMKASPGLEVLTQHLFYSMFERLPPSMQNLPDIGERAFLDPNIEVDISLKKEAIRAILDQLSDPKPIDSDYRSQCLQSSLQSSESQIGEVKGSFNYFNSYFPNVVIIGNVDSKEGKETQASLKELGIQYELERQYDRELVPIEVSRKLVDEIPSEIKAKIIEKVAAGESLTAEETKDFNKIRGASACFLLHRRAILNTINKYREAVKKLEDLATAANSAEQKDLIAKWEAIRDRYASIFIFEHNGRLGSIGQGNVPNLSKHTAEEVHRVFRALPEDWEYFSLFVFDLYPKIDLPSKDIPGTSGISKESPLVHPGVGVGSKAYAFSHRSYADLERLFQEVREDHADRNFYPIDVEFHHLSRKHREEGRRYHLAAMPSLAYRVAGPSFHDSGFASQHFPSTRYLDQLNS